MGFFGQGEILKCLEKTFATWLAVVSWQVTQVQLTAGFGDSADA